MKESAATALLALRQASDSLHLAYVAAKALGDDVLAQRIRDLGRDVLTATGKLVVTHAQPEPRPEAS